MIKLPESIAVCRIPYKVQSVDSNYSYEADPAKQLITVTKDAAPARQRQYFMWEIAHILLTAGGMNTKEADKYHAQVGSVLNRFIVDNTLDWVKGKKADPSMVWINGIPYSVEYGDFEELKAENLGGRITYDTLYIQILDDLEPDIKKYVILHEITHGILFEACAGNYSSREPFVESFAWQILYFIQDNDLSKLKPEGD